MISLTRAFRRELYEDRRNYLTYADITLSDSTVLNLTNEELWSGGFVKEDAVSDDENFAALGSTIIGSATISINNMDDTYSDYDFTNATVITYIGMEIEEGQNTRLEKVKMGTYTVDGTRYNGTIITLDLLDNMEQFDRPYSISTLVYPASLEDIVLDACYRCGVTLASLNFPHKSYEIDDRPEDDSLTFREVLGWAATIAGCFAKCNPDGELELKWFDQATLETWNDGYDGGVFDAATPYATGDTLAGGSFDPWNDGDEADGGDFDDNQYIHFISRLYSQNISTDDVVITGVRITVKDESETATSDTVDYISGSSGYIISISDNGLITLDNAQEIVTWLGTQIIGLTFRKVSVTHSNDPSIEAGDIGIVFDRKNRAYPILITRTTFSVGNAQTTVCGAETPSRNSATRYGQQTKSYVESRKLLKQERSDREQAEANLLNRINSAGGLYYTEVIENNAAKRYLHDKPLLADSSIRILFSTAGITVTSDAGQHWYGLTVNGDMLLNLLSTTGINFDWAHGGTMVLGGQNNTNGKLRMLNASGQEIGSWNKDGITATNFTAYGSLICYETYTIT